MKSLWTFDSSSNCDGSSCNYFQCPPLRHTLLTTLVQFQYSRSSIVRGNSVTHFHVNRYPDYVVDIVRLLEIMFLLHTSNIMIVVRFVFLICLFSIVDIGYVHILWEWDLEVSRC